MDSSVGPVVTVVMLPRVLMLGVSSITAVKLNPGDLAGHEVGAISCCGVPAAVTAAAPAVVALPEVAAAVSAAALLAGVAVGDASTVGAFATAEASGAAFILELSLSEGASALAAIRAAVDAA